MPGFITVNGEAHINNIRTSAPTYMNHYSDQTKRNHMLLMMMAGWGNIEYGASDIARIWQIKVRQPNVRTFSNTTNKTYTDHDPFEQMQVGVRGYEASDLLKELEWKRNQGDNQLVNLYDNKIHDLGTSMVERMQEWLYRDGDTAAYQDGYQGFESCLNPLNVNSGGTDPSAADRIVLPKDSYGGHSTQLAEFGGSWSSDLPTGRRLNQGQGLNNDWPYGLGSSEYDALAPALWNYESTAWASGSAAWEDNVEEVCRESANVLRSRNGMGTGPVDLCFLLAPDLYPGAENYYSSRFRIIQPYSGGDMGFPVPQSMHIDGVALKSDYGCPPGVGYGICPNHIEMFNYVVMNPGGPEPMIDMFGPDWSPEHGAYLMRASTFGNLRMNPKFMCKIAGLQHYIDAGS